MISLVRSALETTARTMIVGGEDLHRLVAFRTPRPDHADPDKFRTTLSPKSIFGWETDDPARAGLEADQHECDQANSDQGS